MLKLVKSYSSPSPQSLCVVVCPWYPPWVASQFKHAHLENATNDYLCTVGLRGGTSWPEVSVLNCQKLPKGKPRITIITPPV